MRGVKSVMQSKLLSGDDKLDSVTLLFYMAPWAAFVLAVLGAFIEGRGPVKLLLEGLLGSTASGFSHSDADAHSATGGLKLLALLGISGLNACLVNVANFAVTAYTGPVSLQVLGNVKNCVGIVTSVAILGNALTAKQGVGVATCLAGVWIYTNRGGPAALPAVAPESAPDPEAPRATGAAEHCAGAADSHDDDDDDDTLEIGALIGKAAMVQ